MVPNKSLVIIIIIITESRATALNVRAFASIQLFLLRLLIHLFVSISCNTLRNRRNVLAAAWLLIIHAPQIGWVNLPLGGQGGCRSGLFSRRWFAEFWVNVVHLKIERIWHQKLETVLHLCQCISNLLGHFYEDTIVS